MLCFVGPRGLGQLQLREVGEFLARKKTVIPVLFRGTAAAFRADRTSPHSGLSLPAVSPRSNLDPLVVAVRRGLSAAGTWPRPLIR